MAQDQPRVKATIGMDQMEQFILPLTVGTRALRIRSILTMERSHMKELTCLASSKPVLISHTVIPASSMAKSSQTENPEIQIQVPRLNGVYLVASNILKVIALLVLFSFFQSAFAQEQCRPLLEADKLADVPCAGSFISGNGPQDMRPPKAVQQARGVLWEHFVDGKPGFVNLEVATKEGLRTRIVYILERPKGDGSLLLRWIEQNQTPHKEGAIESWTPIRNFKAKTIIRHNATGVLKFKDGGAVVGSL